MSFPEPRLSQRARLRRHSPADPPDPAAQAKSREVGGDGVFAPVAEETAAADAYRGVYSAHPPHADRRAGGDGVCASCATRYRRGPAVAKHARLCRDRAGQLVQHGAARQRRQKRDGPRTGVLHTNSDQNPQARRLGLAGTASDKPEALINSPSFDRDLVARRIKGVTLKDRGTDYLATAQLVDKLLKASTASVKEVYWLTDDQANGWANSKQDSARPVWQDMAKQARLIWVSAGAPPGNRDNLVVEAPACGPGTGHAATARPHRGPHRQSMARSPATMSLSIC